MPSNESEDGISFRPCPDCGGGGCASCVGSGFEVDDSGPPVPNNGPQPDGIHTIPVPEGWSPEQAWEAIARGDVLTHETPHWANVLIEDGAYKELLPNTVAPVPMCECSNCGRSWGEAPDDDPDDPIYPLVVYVCEECKDDD